MSLKCGIIGLPNVGKSTLFNLLTNSNVDALNYPFCTIKPNISIVKVPDSRLLTLSKLVNTKKNIYTTITFVDIAGLIQGAHLGIGLGNKFLRHIATVNAIIHVVKYFYDTNIYDLSSQDPIKDIDIIHNELIQFDITLCEKLIIQFLKNKKFVRHKELNLLHICLKYLKKKILLNNINFSFEEKNILNTYQILSIKPIMIVVNMDFKHLNKKNTDIKINHIATKFLTVPICAKLKSQNTQDTTIQNHYLNQIIQSSFNLLNLHNFYTVSTKEVRSWSISKGTIAVNAAKKIHSDIQRGFIRANVISYKDYVTYKCINIMKKFGKIKIEGKKYIINDGDIIHFLFNI
ncbi:redox-regulated ATPase YchF [Enterobacteriaceae endosymbiont of Macroplea appendiculata]|uniref:redox-regulated ATPase YchF n=1 Tax=Enterobacteriaceae endosymbiont of Macroplea appendiculata TaxID=2675790 RepID=UPI0014499028|nr:redox-regulated ATPase YchF [Enterobacteriaceae endosymbiont of Macroplea appendiculata]QJC30724.1 redox-regulated ATPase YchF [Enterobacteriaceae endosymbiont of Macroplea appendiculata]